MKFLERAILVVWATLILHFSTAIDVNREFLEKHIEAISSRFFQYVDVSDEVVALGHAEDNEIHFNYGNSFRRVCFYCIDNKLNPEDVDATLCNYILVCQVTAVNNFLVPANESDITVYPKILDLKVKNPDLKVLLMLLAGSSTRGLPKTVQSEDSRYEFINRLTAYIVNHKFDGVDVDWEFPGWQTNNFAEKHQFTLFIKELYTALGTVGKLTIGKPFLLSVDVASPKTIIDVSYEHAELAKNVDFINIMSYDYHFYLWYLPFTGHNAPLFRRERESSYLATLNTAWSANYWVSLGVPKEKINVGVPTYGHSFTLLDPKSNGVFVLATGDGIFGGWPEYYQVCEFLKSNGTRVFDNEAMVPYAFRDRDWISYDDVDSVIVKAQWIQKEGFGGIMTFNLNCDDWRGSCDNKTKFPLHKAILATLL